MQHFLLAIAATEATSSKPGVDKSEMHTILIMLGFTEWGRTKMICRYQ